MYLLEYKLCDKLSDAVLDAHLRIGPDAKVAYEKFADKMESWFKGTVLQEKGKGESFFFQEMDSENPLPPSLLEFGNSGTLRQKRVEEKPTGHDYDQQHSTQTSQLATRLLAPDAVHVFDT
ncbi:hypothetical protein TURU_138114 [Turdus rufiventris]|nr:hypothetical protein TURU_138114 [Turdus rufiventris]